MGGGKFNKSESKSEIEWCVLYLPLWSHSPGLLFFFFFCGLFPSLVFLCALLFLLHVVGVVVVQSAIYRGKQRPGPGAYGDSAPRCQGGGAFNQGNSKSDLDWLILRAKAQPGPGSYEVPLPPAPGGYLSRGSAKSDLELAVARAGLLPGPGTHNPNHNVRFRSSGSGKFLTVYRPPQEQVLTGRGGCPSAAASDATAGAAATAHDQAPRDAAVRPIARKTQTAPLRPQ
jgi:hypothetical protein